MTLTAYQRNMLKLLAEWQPICFNAFDKAIGWRSTSTGEELWLEDVDDSSSVISVSSEPMPRFSKSEIERIEQHLSGCEIDHYRRTSAHLGEYWNAIQKRY